LGKVAFLVLLLLGLVGLCVWLSGLGTLARFFHAMGSVPQWGPAWSEMGEAPSLCAAEEAAVVLLEQPEERRRDLIAIYRTYLLTRRQVFDRYNFYVRRYLGGFHRIEDDYPQTSFRTFVLLRLVFDLPETRMWPLGYDDGHVVVADLATTWGGGYYDTLAEYDYLAARFPWRSPDELGCR
jgi:hypothetical protein